MMVRGVLKEGSLRIVMPEVRAKIEMMLSTLDSVKSRNIFFFLSSLKSSHAGGVGAPGTPGAPGGGVRFRLWNIPDFPPGFCPLAPGEFSPTIIFVLVAGGAVASLAWAGGVWAGSGAAGTA